MTADRYVAIGDRLVPASEAAIAVDDAGVRHGDAATEPIRVYGGGLFEWDAHCGRLLDQADRLRIDHGLSPPELRESVERLRDANDLTDGLIRCSITAGTAGTTGFATGSDPTVVIITTPLRRGGQDGPPGFDGPATVYVANREVIPAAAIPSGGRTHNQLDRAIAWRERPSAAVDEVLLRDTDGAVADGCRSTPLLVGESALYTPPSPTGGRHRRVMLSVLADLAGAEGFPVHTRSIFPGDFETAAEAFLVNERWGLRPIDTVGDVAVGRGPLTTLLMRIFDQLIEDQHYD